MDVVIRPEPSEEERRAILVALRLEAEEAVDGQPSWRRPDLEGDDGYWATGRPRQSLGAARA